MNVDQGSRKKFIIKEVDDGIQYDEIKAIGVHHCEEIKVAKSNAGEPGITTTLFELALDHVPALKFQIRSGTSDVVKQVARGTTDIQEAVRARSRRHGGPETEHMSNELLVAFSGILRVSLLVSRVTGHELLV